MKWPTMRAFSSSVMGVTLLYALFAGLWVFVSNRMLAMLTSDHQQLIEWQIYKEWIAVDVTAVGLFVLLSTRRRAEQALLKSEQRFSTLFEKSAFIAALARLPDGVLVHVNEAFEKTFGYTRAEAIGKTSLELGINPDVASRLRILAELESGSSVRGIELALQTKPNGTRVFWENIDLIDIGGDKFILTTSEDITERKRAEEELRESEARYRALVDEVNDGFYTSDLHGMLTFSNRALARILGFEHTEAIIGKSFQEFVPPGKVDELAEKYRLAMSAGTDSAVIVTEVLRQDGTSAFIEIKFATIIEDGKPIGYRGVVRDITERKRAEEALACSEKEFRTLAENALVGIYRTTVKGKLLFVNDSLVRILGFDSPQEMTREGVVARYKNPADRAALLVDLQKDGKVNNREVELLTKTDEARSVLLSATIDQDVLTGMVIDITERKMAEEKIKRQLERLSSLRAIDMAIASTFDLKLSLDILLAEVRRQLGVDTVCVLLFNSKSQRLELAAGHGFHTGVYKHMELSVRKSYAGRAVLDRQMVHITNLKELPEGFTRSSLLENEGFVCYYSVPLISKGKVKGVLEIFHGSALEPDQEWLDFLDTLAGQAAIAVDSAELFGDLERSNLDLRLAYDATIEGWSHALDLRDRETEGHTQRVTEMTVELARSFGLNEEELMYVRWGGLLHDIGKMGVPDGILLKPDQLTDEEWVVMKKHPEFAYDMLSPIRYLKSAIDIPYCHHEKWDGTGYPRGLKGEQIPLSARIFAVVDIWDAIRSDRPYRKAWKREKALEHIKSLSGSHLDPKAVDAFLEMIRGKEL